MTAGEFISISFFKRLFLEITRRYKSFKSLVANLPPSRASIGLKSGGMTGITSNTIHSGLLSLFLNASITSSLLVSLALLRAEVSFILRLISSLSLSKSTSASNLLIAAAPSENSQPVNFLTK